MVSGWDNSVWVVVSRSAGHLCSRSPPGRAGAGRTISSRGSVEQADSVRAKAADRVVLYNNWNLSFDVSDLGTDIFAGLSQLHAQLFIPRGIGVALSERVQQLLLLLLGVFSLPLGDLLPEPPAIDEPACPEADATREGRADYYATHRSNHLRQSS